MSLYNFMFADSSPMDQPWFIDSATGRTFTGTEIKARTDALAQGLLGHLRITPTSSTSSVHLDCGIRDVVGVVCPNSVDFGTVVWACHKLGSTVATISGGSTVDELKHQFLLSGTRTVFTHFDSLERVIRAAEECHIPPSCIVVISDMVDLQLSEEFQALGIVTVEALVRLGEAEKSLNPSTTVENHTSPIAFLAWSSGTTGMPKAVIVPHSAIIANVTQMKGASVPSGRVSTGDRALGVVPFSHMFGLLTLVHLCPHIGIATVAFKSMPSFNVFLETIVRLRIGHLFLAPPLVSAFVKHAATPNYDLTFLRSALIAAAPLDGAMESAFQKIGGPEFLVTQGFGMTECGGLITGLPCGTPWRPGSVGRLLSSTEAKIVDERGTLLGPGHPGQLCVRGPQLFLGYLGNAQATKDAFDADGFLLTGDIGDMTADGYFHIVDRLKYMIKNKGYQISPAEIEAHLLSLELVDDAGVVGRPDTRCGEVPVAFIVLSSLGRTRAIHELDSVKDAIKRSVQEAKSDYKWLHDIYFVHSIPRLPSGKIIAKCLKEMLAGIKTSR
ncbi:phenylacetyl-CoA ligase [Mycena rosella]|uniref:Phenylacetyl-CoA ligase n=1 Tax=Mycena rosella TaxID=1033263 RepID=A0AAD7GZF1_MYCRO|nr:phenylacetyl-CoA ligase [Mycena rosella]